MIKTDFKIVLGVLLGVSFLLAFPAIAARADLPVIQDVDPARYLGRWYEIGFIPHWFERGCSETTATYSAGKRGRIRVVNECLRKGKTHQADAVAWHAGEGRDGKFKVQFFWPFSGHYWVIALDSDYQWAMVGHPSRRYLWILSRNTTLPEDIYQRLIDQATRLGYDPSKIIKTPRNSVLPNP